MLGEIGTGVMEEEFQVWSVKKGVVKKDGCQEELGLVGVLRKNVRCGVLGKRRRRKESR